MLRRYENHHLTRARRTPAGQRLFHPDAVGLPVAAVRELLDCVLDTDRLEPCAVPTLAEHLRAYHARIADLVSTRDPLQELRDPFQELIDSSTAQRQPLPRLSSSQSTAPDRG
ncbi:MAG: hypothetical protein NTV28_01270 [Propionibacteriales bacterium]|nr:hypothetical protein [Propionibacteriales bacterium]